MEAAYHACIRLRAAIRVLHQLGGGSMDPAAVGYDELYRVVHDMLPWHEHVLPGMSLSIDLRMSSCSDWNNSHVAEKCVRNAISDALRSHGCASCRSLPPAS